MTSQPWSLVSGLLSPYKVSQSNLCSWDQHLYSSNKCQDLIYVLWKILFQFLPNSMFDLNKLSLNWSQISSNSKSDLQGLRQWQRQQQREEVRPTGGRTPSLPHGGRGRYRYTIFSVQFSGGRPSSPPLHHTTVIPSEMMHTSFPGLPGYSPHFLLFF